MNKDKFVWDFNGGIIYASIKKINKEALSELTDNVEKFTAYSGIKDPLICFDFKPLLIMDGILIDYEWGDEIYWSALNVGCLGLIP